MTSKDKKIFVTQPALPPLDKFVEYLEDIWESKRLTNKGKYHQLFEQRLCDYLGVKYCSLFTNGTLALIVGLQAMRITGEVITTPYSFVASTHALHWNGIKPVFCDIEEEFLNIDADKIESLITPRTTALLPVHVYGHPCAMDKISRIADTYGLKVIYDAAHAFGVRLKGDSILNYGDLSILSFHATKAFNTVEGGAIVTKDKKLKERIDYLKNFGFADEVTVVAPGINAKMSELQAAYGLLQLEIVDEEIRKRIEITRFYRESLKQLKGLKFFPDMAGVIHSYSYFPILIDARKFGRSRDEVYEAFKKQNIYTRRYFYPLISQFPTYRGLPSAHPGNLPVAERITKEVLCLPIYGNLDLTDAERIVDILIRRE
jgi:dTDP-4-amino-4,6-dideoxygalactose transaminase